MKKIDLDNCKNIRDISYGSIKENKLIRSSSLNKLSIDDIKKLEQDYKIKTIIDLRTITELEEQDLIIAGAKYYNIPLVNEACLGLSKEKTYIEKLRAISDNIPDMCDLYKEFVSKDKKEEWTTIFNLLIDNSDGAILWHCSQGKDRAGIVSAIIEYSLGIDYKTIMLDYLTSNQYYIGKANEMYKLMLKITGNQQKANKVKNLFFAKKEYLNSAFNYIKKNYDNMDNFFIEICGLNEEKINCLKSKYLKEECE